jgi:hypothetical protein
MGKRKRRGILARLFKPAPIPRMRPLRITAEMRGPTAAELAQFCELVKAMASNWGAHTEQLQKNADLLREAMAKFDSAARLLLDSGKMIRRLKKA